MIIHFWHNYILCNVWDLLILRNWLYLLFIWYSDLTGCLVKHKTPLAYLVSWWLRRTSVKRCYLNSELKDERVELKAPRVRAGHDWGVDREAVPSQVGGVDRGQIIRGLYVLVRRVNFIWNTLQSLWSMLSRGRGRGERSNLSVKIIILAAMWRRAWRGQEGKWGKKWDGDYCHPGREESSLDGGEMSRWIQDRFCR